jgi:SRSO17 transposase
LRLFLPEPWTDSPDRLQRAGVPEAFRAPRSKPEIALSELDRVLEAGVRFSVAVADAGYGISAAFRQALSARGLLWAVGIPRLQKVYPVDVELTWPSGTRGPERTSPEPNAPSRAAEAMLAGAHWRTLTWRRGTKGPLKAAFAARRVRVADGPAVRLHGRNNQHLPGEEVWLVGERRSSGERKYYLSNLPPDTGLKRLASTIKARWVCEQAHQQLKEELGLDHFEGRSWRGLHRHALMALIAFCLLQHQRLVTAQRGKKQGATAAAEPSGDPPCASRPPRPSCAPAMSRLPGSLQPAPAN